MNKHIDQSSEELKIDITEKDFEDILLYAPSPSLIKNSAKDCFQLAKKMVSQALKSNIEEGEKVLIKRSIEKKEYPKKDYDILLVIDERRCNASIHKWYNFNHKLDNEVLEKEFTHWYEEVTIPSQPLQNGKTIEECLKEAYLLVGEDKDIDLQLAITLNPHLSIIKKAMQLYASQQLPIQSQKIVNGDMEKSWVVNEELKSMAYIHGFDFDKLYKIVYEESKSFINLIAIYESVLKNFDKEIVKLKLIEQKFFFPEPNESSNIVKFFLEKKYPDIATDMGAREFKAMVDIYDCALSARQRIQNIDELHEAFITAMKIDGTKSIYEHLQIAFDWFKTKLQSHQVIINEHTDNRYTKILEWLFIEEKRLKNITDYETAFERLQEFIKSLTSASSDKNEIQFHKEAICSCSDNKRIRVVTVYPLPDICEYCRKALPKNNS